MVLVQYFLKRLVLLAIYRSISRKAEVLAETLKEAAKTTSIPVEHPKEWKLAKCLARFPEVISRTLDDLFIHGICDYLYEVANTFTEFYEVCYCIVKNKQTGTNGDQTFASGFILSVFRVQCRKQEYCVMRQQFTSYMPQPIPKWYSSGHGIWFLMLLPGA